MKSTLTGGRASNGPDGVATQKTGEGFYRTAPTNWLSSDALGEHSVGRQVLVVGDGVAGTLVAGLLRRAGFDPVLVTGAETGPDSRLTYLWPAALRLLEPVGIETAVRDSGTPVESVTSAHTGEGPIDRSRYTQDSTVTSPVVVPSDALLDQLRTALLEDTAVRHRTVDTLEATGDALEVSFEDGVREWFDVVVDASGGRVGPTADRQEPPTVRQWEVLVESAGHEQTRVWDYRQRDAVVELLPSPVDAAHLLRLTTVGTDPVETLQSLDWEGTPVSGESVASVVTASATTTLRQVSIDATVTPEWWGTGRVPCCGRAGFPIVPASGLQVALAIEDAWTLVQQLVRGPEAIPSAVGTYARRRSQRVATLSQWGGSDSMDGVSPSGPFSSPFATVARMRAAALSPISQPESVPGGVVDRS